MEKKLACEIYMHFLLTFLKPLIHRISKMLHPSKFILFSFSKFSPNVVRFYADRTNLVEF